MSAGRPPPSNPQHNSAIGWPPTARSYRCKACRRCRSGIHEAFADRLDAKIQTFQRARAEQNEIAIFAEHDLVDRPRAGNIDVHGTGPARQDRSIGLAEMPHFSARYAELLENRVRKPRQLRAGVDERLSQDTAWTGAFRVLDLDVGAESTHIVGHGSSV